VLMYQRLLVQPQPVWKHISEGLFLQRPGRVSILRPKIIYT
jgi:hypothetical protein